MILFLICILVVVPGSIAWILSVFIRRGRDWTMPGRFLVFLMIFISLYVAYFSLASVSNFFSFDLIHGGDHLESRSETRREAIKRKTFVSDLDVVVAVGDAADTLTMKVNRAWIEKSWSGGTWYWTTILSSNNKFQVAVEVSDVKGEWILQRPEYWEYLGFDSLEQRFSGKITGLPANDTISYFVLHQRSSSRETDELTPSNIVGNLHLIVKKEVDRGVRKNKP